ncbi:MAG: hypothetical protein ABSG68_11615, partial [Thermoguttaceae bacterium]
PVAQPQTAAHIMFAVFSLLVGANTVMANYDPELRKLGITAPLVSLRENFHVLLDGFLWKPLRTQWDYQHTFHRIVEEVFADEWQHAGPI